MAKESKLTVTKAAELMGKTSMFVSIGLRTGKLPFGTAYPVAGEENTYTYYISPKKFYDFTGIKTCGYEPTPQIVIQSEIIDMIRDDLVKALTDKIGNEIFFAQKLA